MTIVTNDQYDYDTFTLASPTVDYDVKAQRPLLFNNVPSAGYCRITANKPITFRVNKITEPEIAKRASENPLKIGPRTLDIPLPYVDNLFITNNSGANVVIGIYLGLALDAVTG